jgi:UDP-glucose 4-epimerase
VIFLIEIIRHFCIYFRMLSNNHKRVLLKGQTVLVTGASGFIGSAICKALQQEGAIVHGISRESRTNEDGCAQWWRCDLSESFEVSLVLNSVRPDFIFHLASHVHGDRALRLVPTTFRDNAMTTINLLTAATEIGCKRIILTGSLEESDPEEGEIIPSSPYAAAKFTSNTYGRMFHRLYQTPIVVLRLFMVYGPAQRDMHKLVPYVTSSFLKNEPPQLAGGNRLVDWIYIDDVVRAYLMAATTPDIIGMTFEIGSGKLVSIRDVVHQLRDMIGSTVEPQFGSVPERPFEQVRAANLAKVTRLPGWKPLTNLAEGLINTVKWYRDAVLHGSLWAQFLVETL